MSIKVTPRRKIISLTLHKTSSHCVLSQKNSAMTMEGKSYATLTRNVNVTKFTLFIKITFMNRIQERKILGVLVFS